MARKLDEDHATVITDSALILDEASDENETLIQSRDSDEATVVVSPMAARAARMQAIQQAGLAGRVAPAARAPEAIDNAPPPFGGVAPAPDLPPDPERRMLPFMIGPQAGAPMAHPPSHAPPAAPAPVAVAPVPVAPAPVAPVTNAALGGITRTQELPNLVAASPAAPLEAPGAHGAQPPMAAAAAMPVPAARPPLDSVMVVEPQGTPPIVVRFLLACGVLTVLGLAALVYLEL